MSTAALRKAGGSLILTVPSAFARQNRLSAGSAVAIEISGSTLTVRAASAVPTLADILKSAPRDAKKMRVPGWDEMRPAGNEW